MRPIPNQKKGNPMFNDQLRGLNLRARKILNLKRSESGIVPVLEVGHRIFPDGKIEAFEREVEQNLSGYKYIEYDYRCGRYEFADGRVFEEVVQAESINGGNLGFAYLALKDGSGQIVEASLWSADEIAQQEANFALTP